MPLALDPKNTFKIILRSDADKPDPPYFLFHYLNGRDWKALSAKCDSKEFKGITAGAIGFDVICDSIRIGLAGWGNMNDPKTGAEIPYDQMDLDLLITLDEGIELMFGALRNAELSIEDKKKLELLLDSNTESSAISAPDPQNVKTDQLPPSQ